MEQNGDVLRLARSVPALENKKPDPFGTRPFLIGSGGRIGLRGFAAQLLLPLFAILRIAAAASEPTPS